MYKLSKQYPWWLLLQKELRFAEWGISHLVNELETITQMHLIVALNLSVSFLQFILRSKRLCSTCIFLSLVLMSKRAETQWNFVWPQASGSSLEVHVSRKTYLLCVRSHIRQLHRNKNNVFIEKQSHSNLFLRHFLSLSSGYKCVPKIRLSRCTRIIIKLKLLKTVLLIKNKAIMN